MSERVEREFHDRIWGAANDFFPVERAVTEARDVMYAILAKVDATTDDGEALTYLAEYWLDHFGRDPLKERKSPSGVGGEQPT